MLRAAELSSFTSGFTGKSLASSGKLFFNLMKLFEEKFFQGVKKCSKGCSIFAYNFIKNYL